MGTKRTQFFDGFQSETTPDTVLVSASGIIGDWKGAWTSQDYVENDAVYFEGSGYICILDTTAQQDPTDPTYWELVSLKGETLDIDEANVTLDEAKIATIEALPNPSPLDRYMITIETDSRANQALPAEISGDQARNLLTWDGSVWKSHGQFIGDDGAAGADGATGPQGPSGEDAAGISVREMPTGIVDGVNDTFTLSNTPTSDQHISVFLDGNFVYDNEFSLVANTVVFITPPAPGQIVFSWYSYGGNPVTLPGTENLEYHTVTAGEETAKQFTLTNPPGDTTKVLVDIIGGTSQAFSIDFTISGSTFDWNGLGLDGILIENDVVRLKYFS